METLMVTKQEQIPKLSPAFVRKVKMLIQEIKADQIKELQDLSQKDRSGLLRGLQDVLEGRVTEV